MVDDSGVTRDATGKFKPRIGVHAVPVAAPFPHVPRKVITGRLTTWPVQAWADGSIYIWDDFADLINKPPQAFYRLRYKP